ncbi:hypothetical protein TNCV_74591 [Trichonephila clavipes]|nr:hypothetical protein TNCV_74591 [Trichonephila clavipes]
MVPNVVGYIKLGKTPTETYLMLGERPASSVSDENIEKVSKSITKDRRFNCAHNSRTMLLQGALKFQLASGYVYEGYDPNIAVVPFHKQRFCKIQLLRRFLYLFETPCKSPAEKAELGTLVSQQPVKMRDTQHSVNTDLGTVLVSFQLAEKPDI